MKLFNKKKQATELKKEKIAATFVTLASIYRYLMDIDTEKNPSIKQTEQESLSRIGIRAFQSDHKNAVINATKELKDLILYQLNSMNKQLLPDLFIENHEHVLGSVFVSDAEWDKLISDLAPLTQNIQTRERSQRVQSTDSSASALSSTSQPSATDSETILETDTTNLSSEQHSDSWIRPSRRR